MKMEVKIVLDERGNIIERIIIKKDKIISLDRKIMLNEKGDIVSLKEEDLKKLENKINVEKILEKALKKIKRGR